MSKLFRFFFNRSGTALRVLTNSFEKILPINYLKFAVLSFRKPIFTKKMSRVDYVPLHIRQGNINGFRLRSIYHEEYIAFEGIPYGRPPVGPLRFKAPQPAEGWSGVRDCTKAGHPPVQVDLQSKCVFGSEDCLYLNVYTKTLRTAERLPVMVWIYGGSFISGYASREKVNPDYFMWKNVVLVTFNYRVGPLGFISFKDPNLDVPGNAGLKDIVLALKWVNDNIECFNGDKNNVTLFGESAGGAAVHFMLTTKQAEGLFHKAIMQSGCMLNPWASIPLSNMPYRLAKIIGYDGSSDESDVLSFLETIHSNDLVDHPVVNDHDRDKGMLYAFAPVVEPYKSNHCIISQPFEKALQEAWGNKIPLIIGGNSFEGIVVYARLKQQPWKADLFFENPEALLPPPVLESSSPEEIKEKTCLLLKTHLGTEKLGYETMLQFLDIFSIRYFWLGLYQSLLIRVKANAAPTYLYRFDFDSKEFGFRRNLYSGGDIKHGVSHADDLQYLFHFRLASKLKENTPEYKTIRRMIGMWYAFAKDSNPNCLEMEDTFWCPVDANNTFVSLNIGQTLTFQKLPERKKLVVWNSLC